MPFHQVKYEAAFFYVSVEAVILFLQYFNHGILSYLLDFRKIVVRI